LSHLLRTQMVESWACLVRAAYQVTRIGVIQDTEKGEARATGWRKTYGTHEPNVAARCLVKGRTWVR
jgi:hypothetical protein